MTISKRALLAAGLTGLTLSALGATRPQLLITARIHTSWAALTPPLMALYAGLLAHHLHRDARSPRLRLRLWLTFTVVFFGQLALGLLGLSQFLMTGALHLPIPALIIAGPIWRGGGLFMVILFLSTLALVGPAWCSHLCYFGALDNLAAGVGSRRDRRPTPRWTRGLILAALITLALALRGASSAWPLGLALAFGGVGIGVILTASRRRRVMTHCLSYCPIGRLATALGRLSPFRMKVDVDACTRCGLCARVCAYDALSEADLSAGRAAPDACTLCRDCEPSCPHDALRFTAWGRRGPRISATFTVLIVSLHAIFLSVARI
ncbi:4Fe-4S binding protein [Myxococcota bacterium]|nr:4Fe-4S binding protein [Myxococcota bacterium]MBU1900162.1 4Fe-4S binding protein [Myxococcota bacterium]